jgi:competence ComEA-like helix-hairpin-helix protein
MNEPTDYGTRFTKKEKRGIFVLILLILLSLAAQLFIKSIDRSILEIKTLETNADNEDESLKQVMKDKTSLFNFDPNQVGFEEMLALGIPEKTAKTILKYRDKGGKFYKPDDMAKIFNMPEAIYTQLKDYIQIGSTSVIKSPQNARPNAVHQFSPRSLDPNNIDSFQLRKLGFPAGVASRWQKYLQRGGRFQNESDLKKIWGIDTILLDSHSTLWQFSEIASPLEQPKDSVLSARKVKNTWTGSIDINSASEPEWQYLDGIGPAYASRIIKYREKLGGFCSIEQVAETFGLPDSIFTKIRPHLILQQPWSQIRINFVTKESLSAHPYINFKEAELLCNFRKHHGAYRSPEDLKKIKVLDKEWIERISPYLDFNTQESL